MDINNSYRFEVEIEELVELVRALDIFGAGKRLSEYEVKLKQTTDSRTDWESICGDKSIFFSIAIIN
jgi:hypothetical protein